jgi:NAD(P)-dependent dehydrogenase (short-subunit alcohol dehydrogenase family)
MNAGLAGRRVVVTGAAGGIGCATTRLLADAGALVLAVDRDEAVHDLVRSLNGEGHESAVADLADPQAAGAIADRALSALGGIDGLVHLAAVMQPRPYDEIDVEHWDLHQQVNVRGSFLLARAVAEVMRPADEGSILLASSGAWLSGGRPDRLPYAVSKGAVTTLVRGLAKALGPRGVRVNGIAPGLVDTPMMNAGLDADTRRELEQETPLGRFGRPEEIAAVAAFLISPLASFVSGATVAVTGGYVLH